jgi:hypothetical protein
MLAGTIVLTKSIAGKGLTKIVILIALPVQLLAVGLTEYITEPCVVTELLSVCASIAPVPAEAPEIPGDIAVGVNENVVPVTVEDKET